MDKPAFAEYRALPALALTGLVPMVQAVLSTPTLWKSPLFVGGFLVLIALTGFGVWAFFAHWKYRAIGPVLIAIGYTLVSFGQPPIYIFSILILAFVVTAYFVSPDRVSAPTKSALQPAEKADLEYAPKTANEVLQSAIRERDNARREAASREIERDAALEELTEFRAKQSMPNLRGKILRFEPDTRNPVTPAIPGASGKWYAAHLEIENLGAPSRTKDWKFILFLENGSQDWGPYVESNVKWAPLPSWPNIEYQSLDELQSDYLENGKVYHVIFRVLVGVVSEPFKSFEVRFKDDKEQEIVCRHTTSTITG